ncbi:hypothetical protein SAMN05443634_105156 [Chishuiella changwenlii]|uniref:C1q domain-containing protein n=1 Tax=Chishuiella changwenlii TaxID=1434701 RepID=A0A1M6X8M4_9FLAO|nr:hypothetical protein [Chishuiella changwenlii]GGF00118.1 hypothetical protein GCM10010984_17100 [Chishuiella changwenlii]SHL02327.1 hypothetical protein SAMN05443634_105156 [Chishuiella changwenlii]
MKKIYFLVTTLFTCTLFSQVGINTNNPQGILHVDAKGDNSTNANNTTDDLIFTNDGRLGIGTITPQNKLQIVGDGINHPINVKNIQPLSTQNSLLYIDSDGNIGTHVSTETSTTQIFVMNAKVPTRGAQNTSESNNGYNTSTGIDLSNISARNYMPWSILTRVGTTERQTIDNISNNLNTTIENTNYIRIPKTGFYSIQVQGSFSCRGNSTLIYYALDMIMYKGTEATTASSSELERKRILVGRNDNTSYAGSFYTVAKLNENDRISFAIAPGLKDDGTQIVTSANSVFNCGIGTPSGNASNFSSISLILL